MDNPGSAFPVYREANYVQQEGKPETRVLQGGCEEDLTKREWFAGQALMGILSNSELTKALGQMDGRPFRNCAHACYEYADAMLEAGKDKNG